jgi:hypothetical protein
MMISFGAAVLFAGLLLVVAQRRNTVSFAALRDDKRYGMKHGYDSHETGPGSAGP